MNKVLINSCYGGFDFSEKAVEWMKENASKYNLSEKQMEVLNEDHPYLDNQELFPRHMKLFIDCVESLGEEASNGVSSLEVVEIEGDRYKIKDYDGYEIIITPEDDDWIIVK